MTRSKDVHSKHGIPNRHILSAVDVTHKFRRHNGHLHLKDIVCAAQVFQKFRRSPAQPFGDEGPQLSAVLQLADSEEPSRLPIRS